MSRQNDCDTDFQNTRSSPRAYILAQVDKDLSWKQANRSAIRAKMFALGSLSRILVRRTDFRWRRGRQQFLEQQNSSADAEHCFSQGHQLGLKPTNANVALIVFSLEGCQTLF
jgi:hypothetical protein